MSRPQEITHRLRLGGWTRAQELPTTPTTATESQLHPLPDWTYFEGQLYTCDPGACLFPYR